MSYANELNRLILEMVKLRNRIDGMDYNDPTYDKLEEELHDIEDEFVDEYGEILEDALADIYEAYCPQLEVLSPIAYLAKSYEKEVEEGSIATFNADPASALAIESHKYPGKDARIAIVPNPTRIVLFVSGQEQEVLWEYKA